MEVVIIILLIGLIAAVMYTSFRKMALSRKLQRDNHDFMSKVLAVEHNNEETRNLKTEVSNIKAMQMELSLRVLEAENTIKER